jgi:glycosyltransferase involved in cell wall biosynthesis
MDDASTDNTPEIVASYGARLKSFRQQDNKGQFGNVNDGLARANGEFIAVYHADDVYQPEIVEHEVAFLRRHPECGAAFCLDIFIDANGREYGRLSIPAAVRGGEPLDYPVVLNTLLTYKNVFLVGPTAMVRASAYREVGPYRGEEFRIASDLEMWVRIAQHYPIGVIEHYLLRYRHGHGNSTQNYYQLRDEPERYFRIMDLALEAGGRVHATREALAGFEAHRAEDFVMLAVNRYIRGDVGRAAEALSNASASRLLASPRIQRIRMTILYLALKVLVRLPRIGLVADVFYRRWRAPRHGASA